MKKNHRTEVAGHASVVQTVFSDFAGHGREIPPAALAALTAVTDWLAGKEIDAKALQAAANLSFQDGVPLAQREKDRALSWARTAAGNLAWLAKKDRGWQEGGATVMDAAEYALSSLGVPGVKDRKQLDVLCKAAMTGEKPGKTKIAKKSAKPLSTNLSTFIGAAANKHLAKLKPVFDLTARGSEDELRALLGEHKFPAHSAVFAFDARYGGLIAADAPGAEGDDWIFGAYACLKSNAHTDPRGREADWVPVAYSPNDYIFYLDAQGRAWMTDTIGDDAPEKFSDDADAMMARIFSGKG